MKGDKGLTDEPLYSTSISSWLADAISGLPSLHRVSSLARAANPHHHQRCWCRQLRQLHDTLEWTNMASLWYLESKAEPSRRVHNKHVEAEQIITNSSVVVTLCLVISCKSSRLPSALPPPCAFTSPWRIATVPIYHTRTISCHLPVRKALDTCHPAILQSHRLCTCAGQAR